MHREEKQILTTVVVAVGAAATGLLLREPVITPAVIYQAMINAAWWLTGAALFGIFVVYATIHHANLMIQNVTER